MRLPHDSSVIHPSLLSNELAAGYALLNKHFTPEQVKLLTHHTKPVRADPHHLLLSKKIERNKEILKIFNLSLKQLRMSGKVETYIAIFRKE